MTYRLMLLDLAKLRLDAISLQNLSKGHIIHHLHSITNIKASQIYNYITLNNNIIMVIITDLFHLY